MVPTTRVWLATFVGLIFTIGLLTGIVVERLVLGPSGPGAFRPGGGPGAGAMGTPGSRGSGRGGGSRRGGGPGGPGPMFGPPPAEYVDQLAREVQLTEDQRAQILGLLQAQEERLRQMQDEARRVFIQEQQTLHDRIAALLTAGQADAFRAWVARRTGLRGQGPPR